MPDEKKPQDTTPTVTATLADQKTIADSAVKVLETIKTERYDPKLGECVWCVAKVASEANDIYVLAEDLAKAGRILKLRYPDSGIGPIGHAKIKPTAGTLRIFQKAPQLVTQEMRKLSNPDDIAEIDRRGDLDYEVHH